jgi:D-beta-D-heptose 7-phosphate kinase/D-beta-D-heptose 1-phosphate adenosyltransferase
MVDGGFDPIHPGHVEYFRRSAELGLPVLCNVTGDHYVARKHPPLLVAADRAQVLDAIRFLDYVHVSSGSTEAVLRTLRPRYYAKGDDWQDKLPDEEIRACEELGIDIVFLDTVTHSSSDLIRSLGARV